MKMAEQARAQLLDRVKICTFTDFDALAMDVFKYQAQHNALYRRYLQLLGKDLHHITRPDQIPHLPIAFFKTHRIKTGVWKSEVLFTSSGTTGTSPSRHSVRSISDYLYSAKRAFALQYGPIDGYSFLALLPAYLERKGSSLVCMADAFIQASAHRSSGFFLHDHLALIERLRANQAQNIPTVLLGVTFALLDLCLEPALKAAITKPELIIVMETGGMKGRRKESTRQEVHHEICAAFGVAQVHSEYGMTELLSQAYAPESGVFKPAPTMRVFTTELNDPFCVLQGSQTGILNITDLANLDTIAFIATEDLGKVTETSTSQFEVLGRADIAEIRGCNLMVE
jgi:hypothetical protein